MPSTRAADAANLHEPGCVQVMRLAAAVSMVQSVLFVLIGSAAFVLGVDAFVERGFATLPALNAGAFRVLCAALAGVALLGLAIAPAEYALVARWNAAWARFGARMAYFGHAGTIAYFSCWLAVELRGDEAAGALAALDAVAPITWGLMFELVFVGAWVWVIAAAARCDPQCWPRGFGWLSVAKGLSFWAAYAALWFQRPGPLLLGLGAVCFFTGPVWHAWFAWFAWRQSSMSERART